MEKNFSMSTSKKALLQFRIGSHKLSVNNRKHFNVPRADRHCTHCDKSLMWDEIHCLYECTKLNNLRVKYMSSPGIRREPNVFNFVNIMQTNDPETIGNLAKVYLAWIKTIHLTCYNVSKTCLHLIQNIIIVFYNVNVYILPSFTV